jgi:hypothetical protein
MVDRVDTGDGIKAAIRKWQRPSGIYRPKYGLPCQAALCRKLIGRFNALFVDINSDNRATRPSCDP